MPIKTLYIFLFLLLNQSLFGQNTLFESKNESPFFDNKINNFIPSDEPKDVNTNWLDSKLPREWELSLPNPNQIFQAKLSELKSTTSLSSELNNFESQKRTLHDALKENTKFSGDLEIESYMANNDLPFALNERQYTRVYATPQVTLFGLPFETDIYYTTEDNSYFNSNSITFRFDINEFKKNIKGEVKETIEEKKSKLFQIIEVEDDLEIYKSDIDRQINGLENDLNEITSKYNKEFAESALNDQKEILANQIDSVSSASQDAARDSISSIRQNKKAQLQDSLSEKKNEVEYKLTKLKQYLQQVDSIQRNIEKRKSQTEKAIALSQGGVENEMVKAKNGFLKNSNDSIKNRVKLSKVFNSIQELEMGLFNPYYSKSTLNGLPIKGVNIMRKLDNRKMYTRLSVGSALSSFRQLETGKGSENLFNRRVMATKIGFGDENFDDMYFISATFWDRSDQEYSKLNTVQAFGINKVIDQFQFDLEIAHSFFKERNPIAVETFEDQTSLETNILPQLSLTSSASYHLKNSSLKVKLDQKNGSFRSFGSPYMNNDYRTLDFLTTQKLFKNKLNVSAFYKYFTDNLASDDDNTNKMRGFGATLFTNFKKAPNFFVSYSPFEQSNYHQDSLQRTNNKFSSLVAQSTYSKSFENHRISSVVSYSLALVEYSESNFTKSNTRILSFNQSYQNQKLRCNLGYSRSRTLPSIDSLSFNAINATINLTIKKIRIGANLHHKYTLSNGKQLSQAVTIEYRINKRISTTLTTGVKYFDKTWGLQNESIGYGLVNLKFKL